MIFRRRRRSNQISSYSRAARGSHYRKPKRWKRIILWTVLSILGLIIVAALAGFLFVYHTLGEMSSNNLPVVQAAKEQLDIPNPDQPENILVMGEDDSSDQGNSDTMMLMRVDPNAGFVSILSIPRDLEVDIPGHGEQKINAAYPIGGAPLAIQTVKKLTGEPIHHFVTMNFSGFEKAVDALGGVYVDVDQRYYNDNSNASWGKAYEPINLQPGYQRLNGHDALEFARYRHTDSDFVRIARQQAFITDAKSQLINWGNITKIPELADIFGSNTTSDIGAGDALSLIKFALGVQKDHIFQQQFPIQEQSGSTYLLVDSEKEKSVLKSFESPDLSPPQPAVPGANKSQPQFPSQQTLQTQVVILNGGAPSGSAAQVADLLKQKGLTNVTVGGDANNTYEHNQVYYDENSKAAADELSTLFQPADESSMPTGLSISSQVLIVLGSSYAGSLTQPQKPQPQASTLQFQDTPQTTPRWQQAASQSPFKLERPTSFPTSFQYDDFRSYQISTDDGPKPALKVVCEDQNGNPWGIMETTFTDAPLLNQPSVQKRVNGKNYMFFYSDDKLKYLAWKDNGVLYWISNSLMSTLDESTMLQLATSFQQV